MRALFILAATLLVGITIGLEAAGQLEPFLEPILAFFAGPEEPSLYLFPVDYDPFAPCYGVTDPHDLCI